MALSADPRRYVQLKALGTVGGVRPVIAGATTNHGKPDGRPDDPDDITIGNSITYTDIYGEGTELKRVVGENRVSNIVKRPEGSTLEPRFMIIQGPDCQAVFADDQRSISFIDENGDEYMKTGRASGWWGAEDQADAEIAGTVGDVLLVNSGEVKEQGVWRQTFHKVQSGPEWGAASGNSWIDDSVNISGTSDLSDAFLHGGVLDTNFLTHNLIFVANWRASLTYRLSQWHKVENSAIPEGTILSVTHNWYQTALAGATIEPIQMKSFRCLQTVVDEEITANEYSSGNSWDTQFGLTSGTDYSATEMDDTGVLSVWSSPPEPVSAERLVELTMVPQEYENWRDGVNPNNGILTHAMVLSAIPGRDFRAQSVDDVGVGTNPTVDITYTPPGGMVNRVHFFMGDR